MVHEVQVVAEVAQVRQEREQATQVPPASYVPDRQTQLVPESTLEAGQVMQLELVTPEQVRQERWQATQEAAPAS